jgi:hypothetical protein
MALVFCGVVALIIAIVLWANAHEADVPEVIYIPALALSMLAVLLIFFGGVHHAIPNVPRGKAVRVLANYTMPSGNRAIEVAIAPNNRVTRVEAKSSRESNFPWTFPSDTRPGQLLICIEGRTLVALSDTTRFSP